MQSLRSFDIIPPSEDGSNGLQQQAQPPPFLGYGYDVLVRIIRATNLPVMDFLTHSSDPYIILRMTTPCGQDIQYKTRTVLFNLQPEFGEFFELGNVPEGSQLSVEAWDKNLMTADQEMGKGSWLFAPQQWQQQGQHSAASGALPVHMQLQHPMQPQRQAGQLELEVHYHPSQTAGQPCMLGPVRFSQHFSPSAGVLMRHWNDDRTLDYCTWKIVLCHVDSICQGVSHPWNRQHDKAAQIYNSPLLLKGVRSQHAALYATQAGKARFGVLRNAADLFSLFNNGVRGGQRRYFTYSLLPDSLRCSETGTRLLPDIMSKHAVHAGGAQEVIYAGEFCIVPDAAAAGGHRLVLDNNSGTFAPSPDHLPCMQRLFAANFPDLQVEVVAVGDPRLQEYHRQCPSRLAGQPPAAAGALGSVFHALTPHASGHGSAGRRHVHHQPAPPAAAPQPPPQAGAAPLAVPPDVPLV